MLVLSWERPATSPTQTTQNEGQVAQIVDALRAQFLMREGWEREGLCEPTAFYMSKSGLDVRPNLIFDLIDKIPHVGFLIHFYVPGRLSKDLYRLVVRRHEVGILRGADNEMSLKSLICIRNDRRQLPEPAVRLLPDALGVG